MNQLCVSIRVFDLMDHRDIDPDHPDHDLYFHVNIALLSLYRLTEVNGMNIATNDFCLYS